MYQRINSIDVHRNIKSYTTATFILNCIIGLIVLLILSVLVLALLPLYLPFHNFIPANLDNKLFISNTLFSLVYFLFIRRTLNIYAYCHISNIVPTRSNTSIVLINDNNWPIVEQTVENLLNLKLNNIEFTNISDVRIVDSISSTWCNTNGCLRVLGKIIFSIDCPLTCQLHKINKIENLNLIKSPIKINLNSTLNISYVIEIDAFTVVVLEGEEKGDEVKMFLLYNLTENQLGRALSSMNFSVDNSSLINITRLVNNSIIQSHMNIYQFNIIQADVNMKSSILNVTVLFIFSMKCMVDCQEIEVNKLRNITLNNLNPIFIIYNGKIHFHNVSLIDIFVTTSSIITTFTTENTMMPNNSTTETTSLLIIYVMESIFQVDYKVESFDLIIEGDLELGPIIDYSTLYDLTNMLQTTISNYSNITVIVFNATIEIDNENSTTKSPLFNSINYILRLIVYYIYPATCYECIQISNNSVYNEPQLNRFIQIRNATLIDISSPILVINIIPHQITTTLSSNYTVSMSTFQFSTTNSNNKYSTNNHNTTETTSSTLIHTTTYQHQITDHNSTIFTSTEHSTLHTTEHTSHQNTEHMTIQSIQHTSLHPTEHTSHQNTEHITLHSTDHTSHQSTEHTTLHTTEHTSHQNTEHTTLHSTDHTALHTTEHTSHQSTEHTTLHSTGHTSLHTSDHTTTHHTSDHTTTHHTSDHTTTHPHTSIHP